MMRVKTVTAALAAASLALPVPALAQTRSGNPLSAIFQCEASGSKQESGAIIGGLVGGVLGRSVAKNERGLGTVLGAALGAAAGSYIGCRMQKSDQEKAEAAARAALDRGGRQTWRNPETGAYGDVQVISTRPYGEPVDLRGLRLASGVELARSYDGAQGRYEARGAANLRAGPSINAPIVGKLRPGETVDAVAWVTGDNWLLVGRNGVAIGYVSEGLVRPVGGARYATSEPLCRTFDQTIATRGGGADTRRYTACRDAGGDWVVQG